jgi:hypothetical protein
VEGDGRVNPFTVSKLNGYAQECGFASDVERFEMILNVPAYLQDQLEEWLDTDGSHAGLVKILETKRPVRRKGEL